jgi:hypothetical protein
MYKKILTAFTFITLFCTAPLAFAKTPAELSSAIDAYMNADFNGGLSKIEGYISSHPNDAIGYLVRGMCREWQGIVLEKKDDKAVMSDYEKANDLAQVAHDANENDLDSLILLGNTYMYLAKKQVDLGSKLTGGNTLSKSKNYMLQAIAKNPNASEAYLALGIFNYFSENIPSGFKWLAMLMGFKGDAALGQQYIDKAAASPNLTQGDAQFMQEYVAHKSKNYVKAFSLAQTLSAHYPNNPKFMGDVGEYAERTHNYAASREAYGKYFAQCQKLGGCSHDTQFLANFFMAWGFIDEKNYAEAKPYVMSAVQLNPGRFKDRNVYLDFWQGLLAKNEGKKEVAKAYFEKAADGKKHAPELTEAAKAELKTVM